MIDTVRRRGPSRSHVGVTIRPMATSLHHRTIGRIISSRQCTSFDSYCSNDRTSSRIRSGQPASVICRRTGSSFRKPTQGNQKSHRLNSIPGKQIPVDTIHGRQHGSSTRRAKAAATRTSHARMVPSSVSPRPNSTPATAIRRDRRAGSQIKA